MMEKKNREYYSLSELEAFVSGVSDMTRPQTIRRHLQNMVNLGIIEAVDDEDFPISFKLNNKYKEVIVEWESEEDTDAQTEDG